MSQETETQLRKVRRVSEAIKVLVQIALAFGGIGMAMCLIGIVAASSFQVYLGDGDFALSFFSGESPQAVVQLYDSRSPFGVNIVAETPAAAEVTRLVTAPTMPLRVTTGLVMFLNVSVVLFMLEQLSRLFTRFANGEIFTRPVVARIRVIGYALLGFPAVSLLNSIFAVALAAQLGASGESTHLTMDESMLAVAVVVILISRIMDVGRAMQEEQELTI